MTKHLTLLVTRILPILLFIGLAWGQQIAKTNEGKTVVLFDDGTWQYLEKNSVSNQVQTNDTQIFITKSGKKYHLDGCRWLKGKISSTIAEASSKGLAPCKVCSPPSMNTNYNTNKPLNNSNSSVFDNRCQATTKKGTQCKRNSESNRNYCWQHP